MCIFVKESTIVVVDELAQNWFRLYFVLLMALSSQGTTQKITVYRGVPNMQNMQKPFLMDFFSYEPKESTCENDAAKWCRNFNAYRADKLTPTCSCSCDFNFKTFIPEEGRCFNDSYFVSSDLSGKGLHMLFNAIALDLSKNGTKEISNKICQRCRIDAVQYLMGDQWKYVSRNVQKWKIENDCKLKWSASNSHDLRGKILKIQLKGCNNLNSWSIKNPSILLKSKGNYSIEINVPATSLPYSSTRGIVPTSGWISSSVTESSIQTSAVKTKMPTQVSITSPLVAPTTCSSNYEICSSSITEINVPATSLPYSSTRGIVPTSGWTSSSVTESSIRTSAVKTKMPTQVSITSPLVAPTMCSSNCEICSSSITEINVPATSSPYSSTRGIVPTSGWTSSSVTESSIRTSAVKTKMPTQVSITSPLVAPTMCSSNYEICSSSITGQIPDIPKPTEPNKGKLKDKAPLSTGATAGTVIGCILLAGIVVLFIVWKRRIQRFSCLAIQDEVPPDSKDNPMYGKNKGEIIALSQRQDQDTEEEEYDYAAVDGDHSYQKPSKPIYQSLVKEPVGDSVYASLNKGTPEEYSYNHLEHPAYNPPHSKGVPSEYAALQRPSVNDDYLKPGINTKDPKGTSEPVYSALEDLQAGQASQDSDPVYNVLKDPDANQAPINEPLYNVLEDPDAGYDNAPIENDQNHPASGQDNIAYSSTIDLNIPQAPSCPDYAVLEKPEDPGGTIPDSAYQPLDVRVQDDGVYQPLERTSRSIYQSLQQNDSTA